ncbi:polysaccharide pyruvyl transferase family protein [Serratia fonticola]
MKVAILTLPLHTNYGGNVQAFALQKVLRDMGHAPVMINYRKSVIRRNIIIRVLSKIKRLIVKEENNMGYRFTSKERKEIDKHHDFFINDYLDCSSPLYNEDELRSFVESEGFDVLIVGSDQVWRPKYTPNIEPFFFGFLKERDGFKKIAYAASFGSDVWEYTPQQTELCAKLLQDFSSVSVRESLGVEMCKKYLNVTAEHVLDPTLLLDKSEYIKVFNNKNLPDNQGKVFNYLLDSSDDKFELLQRISQHLGKEIFSTYPSKTIKHSRFINDINDYQFPQVEAWLKSFYDADFVITDSFHGTVFSIIFNKPFIAICNKSRGAARFYSLLKILELEDRLVNNFSEVKSEVINSNIDFDKVNRLLNEAKQKSLTFISNSLGN